MHFLLDFCIDHRVITLAHLDACCVHQRNATTSIDPRDPDCITSRAFQVISYHPLLFEQGIDQCGLAGVGLSNDRELDWLPLHKVITRDLLCLGGILAKAVKGVQRVDIVIGVEITVILGVHINKVEFTLPLADKLLKLNFWGFTRVIVGFESEFLFWF